MILLPFIAAIAAILFLWTQAPHDYDDEKANWKGYDYAAEARRHKENRA